MVKARRKNPADDTVQAARAREARILDRLKRLELSVTVLSREVDALTRARRTRSR